MEARLQAINDDIILEVVDTVTQKVRHSKNAVLRQKLYLEESIAHFQGQLDSVNAVLDLIENEEAKAAEIKR